MAFLSTLIPVILSLFLSIKPKNIITSSISRTMAPPTFMGGKLFKSKSKKKKKSKHGLSTSSSTMERAQKSQEQKLNREEFDEDEMTDAEKKALAFKQKRENIELKAVAKKSHRERVDEFNAKLSQLTEHNDIPRVSAAGNG